MNKSITLLRNRYLFLADLAIIVLSILVSFSLRVEFAVFVSYLPAMICMIVVALVVKPLVYWRFGLYRRFWAYASTKEALIILAAVAVNVLLMFGYYLLTFALGLPRIPRSIPIIAG